MGCDLLTAARRIYLGVRCVPNAASCPELLSVSFGENRRHELKGNLSEIRCLMSGRAKLCDHYMSQVRYRSDCLHYQVPAKWATCDRVLMGQTLLRRAIIFSGDSLFCCSDNNPPIAMP